MPLKLKHFALVLPLLSSAAGLRAATYTVQTLAYPGATQTYAQAINSSGVVAGYYTDDSGTSHGFIWTAGSFKPVTIPGVSGVWVTGINDQNVVCGYFHIAKGNTGETVGFTLGGGALNKFAAGGESRSIFPAGINNSGAVSGYKETGALSAGVYSGFLLSSAVKGKATPVNVSGESNTWGSALNNRSDVVGYAGANLNPTTPVEAFIYQGATGQFLTVNMPGMVQTRFYGINDLGAIAGYALDTDQLTHSFLYRSGSFEEFTLADYTVAIPQGIDNSGIIVGYAITSPDTIVGFIATPTP